MKTALTAALALTLLCACSSVERSWKGGAPPVRLALAMLLAERPPVSLAVVAYADHAFSAEAAVEQGADLVRWRQGAAALLLSRAEQGLLRSLRGRPGFSLVDRAQLDKVMDELARSLQPEFSDERRAELGRLTGATHLLLLHCFRAPRDRRGGFTDTLTARLVDARTGQVVAAQHETERR